MASTRIIKIRPQIKPLKRTSNRVEISPKKRTRIIRIPHTGISTPYFEPENWHKVSEIGRSQIFVSKPNKGMKEKWFVIKEQSVTNKPQLYAALDPIGEARMQKELEKKLEGSPIGVAKPIALVRTTEGVGKNRKTITQIVSEFVSGVRLPIELVIDAPVLNEEGLWVSLAGSGELKIVQDILRSKGILALDLHSNNVLRSGNKFVLVDVKHLTFHPESKEAEKLERNRWIARGNEQKRVKLLDHFRGLVQKITPEYIEGINKEMNREHGYEIDRLKNLEDLLKEWPKLGIGGPDYYEDGKANVFSVPIVTTIPEAVTELIRTINSYKEYSPTLYRLWKRLGGKKWTDIVGR